MISRGQAERLLELAEKATDEPWVVSPEEPWVVNGPDRFPVAFAGPEPPDPNPRRADFDAVFIAEVRVLGPQVARQHLAALEVVEAAHTLSLLERLGPPTSKERATQIVEARERQAKALAGFHAQERNEA